MCVGPGLKPATGVSSAAAAASGPVVSAESPVVSAAPRVVGQKLPVDDSISSPIEAIFSTVLDLPPSCVEFSPLSPELFVVGTYNLESEVAAQATDENGDREENDETPHSKTVQSRNGSLILFQISDETLILIQTLNYPSAILDLHFSPHKQDLFAVASSTGSISLYTLDSSPVVAHLQTFQLFPPTTLILSLSWHPTDPNILGVSLSTSHIAILQLSPSHDSISILTSTLNHHSGLEAWTLAFSPPTTISTSQTIYSGGDDSLLLTSTFTARSPTNWHPTTTKSLKGHHTAGITAILPLPLSTPESMLLTGSYDDHIRLLSTLDSEPSSRVKVLCELNLGGGVWRLKFLRDYSIQPQLDDVQHVQLRFRVLASCMHAGARVLQVTRNELGQWGIEVLARMELHKSMCYGSDMQPVNRAVRLREKLDDGSALCVSTSFYDRLLCVWRFVSPT